MTVNLLWPRLVAKGLKIHKIQDKATHYTTNLILYILKPKQDITHNMTNNNSYIQLKGHLVKGSFTVQYELHLKGF